MTNLEICTDDELIEELAARYEKLIVIRPKRKEDNTLTVTVHTAGIDPYDKDTALAMLCDAVAGLEDDIQEELN